MNINTNHDKNRFYSVISVISFIIVLAVSVLAVGVGVILGQDAAFQGVSGFGGKTGFGTQQGFTITVSPATIPVTGGSTANATVTVGSFTGFNSPVVLTAAPGPAGVTYSFSPSTVTPPANGTVTSTLTVTAASSAPAANCPGGGNFTVTGTFGVVTQSVIPCAQVTSTGGTYTLSVFITGLGSVTSSPAGISCPGTCFANFTSGTVVTISVASGTLTSWSGSCSGSGGCSVTMNSPQSVGAAFSNAIDTAALPQAWVDPNELVCTYTGYPACYNGPNGQSPALTVPYIAPGYEISLGVSGGTLVSGSIPGYCTLTLANYTSNSNATGLQAAITDTEACRTTSTGHGTSVGAVIDYPPGLYASLTGLVIPQTNIVQATSPIILRTTNESTLIGMAQPVCAGGVQDNLATSTHPALHNPNCLGDNMYYTLGPSISGSGDVNGWQTLTVNTTTLSAITLTGIQAVPLANGYVAPGNTIIIDDGTGGNAETLTTLTGANNNLNGMEINPTKSHLIGATVKSPCLPSSCSITLANGNATNATAYNYEQYLAHITCTSSTNCIPIQLCTPSVLNLATPCGSSTLGPDHWQINDVELSAQPGFVQDTLLFQTGAQSISATNISQFAHNIHLRRVWVHGDWTSLFSGTNIVSEGINFNGCYYCSALDWQASQLLRPGAEGHALLGQGQVLRLDNYVVDCCSSAVFGGGLATVPGIPTFIPFTNVEKRKYLSSFPYSWLGFQCTGTGTNNTGNACGLIPDSNWYWGGMGDNFDYGTLTNAPQCDGSTPLATCVNVAVNGLVTYVSGPRFHGANSLWSSSNVNIKILKNTTGNTCISGAGCTDYYAYNIKSSSVSGTCPASCPTTFNLTATSVPALSNVPAIVTSPSIVRKNADEMKEGQYVLDDGGINENIDQSGGQSGAPRLMTVRQTSGGGVGQNYYSIISDVTVTNNITRNGCTGRAIAGRSAGGQDGGGVSYPMARVYLSNLLDYNMNQTNPGCGSATFGWNMSSIGQTWTGTIASSGGTATFTAVNSVQGAASVSTAVGYQVFNISAGEPVVIFNCTNTAFNTPTITLGAHIVAATGPLATTGSTPWSGSSAPGNYTVSYPFATAGTENSGTCTITNITGSPKNVTINHATIVTSSLSPIGQGPALQNKGQTAGANHQINHIFTNSIIYPGIPTGTQAGWYNTIFGEGTNTELYNYDTGSMTATYLVWVGRTGSRSGKAVYTEYGNNSTYTDPNGCTGAGCAPPCVGTGCNPSGLTNWFFPATSGCGATPSSTCVGWSGGLNITNVAIQQTDYHAFALCTGSAPYSCSGIPSIYHNAASDGTDMGVIVPNLDAAQTAPTYQCSVVPCGGSPGPFPD